MPWNPDTYPSLSPYLIVRHARQTLAFVAAVFGAKQAGGTVVQPLERKGDGDCRGGVADGNGAVWWLSHQDE